MRLFIAFVLLCLPVVSNATPYLPGNDDAVLQILPQPEGSAAIRNLQHLYHGDPTNIELAYALIDAYIKLGKQEADPRYYGYAEAMIKPLLAAQKDSPNTELLVEEANVLQHRHDFDGALVILKKVLRKMPDHPTAHLMRAVIEIVRGDYGPARQDCRYVLSPANGAFVGITCIAMIDALTGQLPSAYQRLNVFYQRFGASAGKEEIGWTLNTLGEMSERLGDNDAAERDFRNALKANSNDYYAMAALADLLLGQNRPLEVISLLEPYTSQDNLLLRLTLAENLMHGPKRDDYVQMMKSRIQASQQRNEIVHLRDYARFALEVEGDKKAAFRMAKENWKTQKESADALILIQSALAVDDLDTVRDVMSWEHEQGYQDVSFERFNKL